jgi:AhpD family alkylhydroperoxidase
MNYAEISKSIMTPLYEAYAGLKNSPLSPSLRVLLELRVSQINGCAYCCNLHYDEAKKLGIAIDKIDQLKNWKESENFLESEKEALSWAESLTSLSTQPKAKVTNLSAYFSEREIVDITICISLMHALNRLAISLRD